MQLQTDTFAPGTDELKGTAVYHIVYWPTESDTELEAVERGTYPQMRKQYGAGAQITKVAE